MNFVGGKIFLKQHCEKLQFNGAKYFEEEENNKNCKKNQILQGSWVFFSFLSFSKY